MVNPEEDFVPIQQRDAKLAELVESVMKTDEGTKDRKTILTTEQALRIAIARAYADSFIVLGVDPDFDGPSEEAPIVELEGPLEIVHMICDYLENTSVSVNGKGLKQMVEILTAQVSSEDPSSIDKTTQRVMR